MCIAIRTSDRIVTLLASARRLIWYGKPASTIAANNVKASKGKPIWRLTEFLAMRAMIRHRQMPLLGFCFFATPLLRETICNYERGFLMQNGDDIRFN